MNMSALALRPKCSLLVYIYSYRPEGSTWKWHRPSIVDPIFGAVAFGASQEDIPLHG